MTSLQRTYRCDWVCDLKKFVFSSFFFFFCLKVLAFQPCLAMELGADPSVSGNSFMLKGGECFRFLSSFEKLYDCNGIGPSGPCDVRLLSFSCLSRHMFISLCLEIHREVQNGNALEIELLFSWMVPQAFRKHFVKLLVGTFCTGSGASVFYLGIMALPRKEQACSLKPFYLPSVGFACSQAYSIP